MFRKIYVSEKIPQRYSTVSAIKQYTAQRKIFTWTTKKRDNITWLKLPCVITKQMVNAVQKRYTNLKVF